MNGNEVQGNHFKHSLGDIIITRSWSSDIGHVDCVEWYVCGSIQSHWDTYQNFVNKYGHKYDNDIKQMYIK